MSIIRTYAGETLDANNNINRKTIRYWVPGELTSDAAVDELQGTEINFGDPDPDDNANGLTATEFRAVERAGSGSEQGFFVEVTLTRGGGGFSGPPINNQDPGYRLVDLTTERRRLTFPVLKKIPVAYSTGSSVVNSFDWIRDDREYEQRFLILRVRCNVPSGSYIGANFDAVIAPQVNKVHTLYTSSSGLNKWRFLGANANQVNGDVFRVTYEWEQDRGSDAPDNASADNGTVGSNPILLPPARPPYHDWEVRFEPVAGPTLGPQSDPVIEATEMFEEDLTGAAGFLGNPLGAL